MRRILIFSLVYYPRYVGGAEIAVKEITDRIHSDEVVFDMITMRTEKLAFERIGNINIHRVGLPWYGKSSSPIFFLAKYIYMPFALIKALRLHSENRYDVIWPIMASYASGPALFFKLLHKNVKLVLTLQEGDPFTHIRKRVGITYPFFKKLFKVADHISTLSQYLADWAKEMGAKCPITIVPNAVDFAVFSKQVPESVLSNIKTKLGKKENDLFLITASRLVEKNAVSDIIKSLTYLPKNVKLLVLGKGDLEQKLVEESVALELENRIQFLGYIPHSEMLPYLKISDIFIRPSLSEGFGNSFIEAMAAEIPVIATPVGGIVDFLKNGETGLFCETRNPASIAQKVEKLMKDPDSRSYIVRQAKKMVEVRYGWEKISGEMKRVLMG